MVIYQTKKWRRLMRKNSLVLLGLVLLLLNGCINAENDNKNTEHPEAAKHSSHQLKYEGTPLKIAVAGNEKLAQFDNVSYQDRDLEYLSTNDEESFDALIITKDAFQEADKEEYVEFFRKVKYPVFFIGTEKLSLSAFLEKGTTLEMAKVNQTAYVQGYKNTENMDTNEEQWNLHLPERPTEQDKNGKILVRIFEIVKNSIDEK